MIYRTSGANTTGFRVRGGREVGSCLAPISQVRVLVVMDSFAPFRSSRIAFLSALLFLRRGAVLVPDLTLSGRDFLSVPADRKREARKLFRLYTHAGLTAFKSTNILQPVTQASAARGHVRSGRAIFESAPAVDREGCIDDTRALGAWMKRVHVCGIGRERGSIGDVLKRPCLLLRDPNHRLYPAVPKACSSRGRYV